MAKLTDRLSMYQAARFAALMERRASQGLFTVNPAVTRAVLWALVNHSDADGISYPSIDTLALESDSAVRTVKRVIRLLRQEGIVRVTARNRGATAGSKRGPMAVASTNLYRIDWSRLHELREGGALLQTGANVAPVPDGDGAENRGQPDPRTGASLTPEQGPHVHRTGATRAQNRGQSDPCSTIRIEPSIEPSKNHPPNPPEGAGGCVGDDELREQAEAILREYPTTAGDRWLLDVDATVEAIRYEATQSEGVTWSEIRDAAVTLRRSAPSDPMWPRRWMGERGYLRIVLAARDAKRRHDSRPASPTARMREVEREVVADQAEVDRVLSQFSPDELRALADEAIARLPDQARHVLQIFATNDPTQSRTLRSLIYELVQERAGQLEGAA